MELPCMNRSVKVASALLAAFLVTTLNGSPQEQPAAAKPAETRPTPASPADLHDQIQELSSALQAMRAEVSATRTELVELRQDLKAAREQLSAIKGGLAASTGQEKAPTAPVPPATASREAEVPQLEARVSKMEEEHQLLSAKVDDQYQTKVESGSKYRVRLSGMALLNAFTTRGATDNFDVPDYATPHYDSETNAGFGATARQSLVGLEVFGPSIAGARSSAEIQMDFFGGFPSTSYGITTGLVRMRTAGLRLDWEKTSLVAGQEAPFFSPLSPTSLVSVANPALSSAGNLWVWTPQVYLEHRISLTEGSSVSLEGGLMDPLTGELPADPYYRAAEAGEKSGQPAYAARVAWTHGTPFGPATIGAGGYYARQNWGYGRLVDAWAGTADWSLPLSQRLSLSGEFYRGRAIGGLGAAEGRSIAYYGYLDDPQTVIRAPNSTGGWAQLKFMALPKLEFNGAYGEDFTPTPGLQYTYQDEGYESLAIGRNQSWFLNSIYHVRSNLIFSLEYRRLRTVETHPGMFTANQVGLGAAALF